MQTTMNLGPNSSVERWTSGAKLLAVMMLTVGATACAREPETVEISATTHNYSMDKLFNVRVNGKGIGSAIDAAKTGNVTGGGVLCCVALKSGARIVTVELRAKEQGSKGEVEQVAVQARFRQPWPEIASYAVFNVLPGRRVLVEVVPGYLIPSGDRLAELEKAWKESE